MTNPAPAELTRNEVLKLLRDVKDILYFHRPGFMGPLNEWAMTDEALRASRDEYKRKYEQAQHIVNMQAVRSMEALKEHIKERDALKVEVIQLEEQAKQRVEDVYYPIIQQGKIQCVVNGKTLDIADVCLTGHVAALTQQLAAREADTVIHVAACTAHRACCGTEHDPTNGKLHGYCVVCGVDWPCETARVYLAKTGA